MLLEDSKEHGNGFDFDRRIDRRGTSSYKWDYCGRVFGREDVLPMWVADMDFRAPRQVIEALKDRAGHGVFGYTARPAELYDAVIGWFAARYGWRIEREWILATPGVVPALDLAIEAYTAPGDGVIIQPPVYYPFRDAVRRNGRRLVNNRLLEREDGWRIDSEALGRDCRRASMLVLCSPHNPVGRVWTATELRDVVRVCAENDVTIFSDEIHADIVHAGNRHVPTATLDGAADITVSAYATSKTFNLAGLQMSLNVIPDPKLRREFREVSDRFHMGMSNVFAIEATRAAYSCGEEWLEALLAYLRGSFDLLEERLKSIPGVAVRRPEGTYLAWLDCRGLDLDDDALEELFVQGAGLGLNRGSTFGPGGEGHMRMNLACPRSVLAEALDRLERAVARLRG